MAGKASERAEGASAAARGEKGALTSSPSRSNSINLLACGSNVYATNDGQVLDDAGYCEAVCVSRQCWLHTRFSLINVILYKLGLAWLALACSVQSTFYRCQSGDCSRPIPVLVLAGGEAGEAAFRRHSTSRH